MRVVTLSLLFLMVALTIGCSNPEPTPTSHSVTKANRVPRGAGKTPGGQ
jgi:hypothetical protein